MTENPPRKKKRKRRRKPGALSQWLQGRLFAIAVLFLGGFSPRTRVRIAAVLGPVIARLLPIRRSVVEENLRFAFPDWDAAQREKVVVECYVNLIANALDVMTMARATPEDILAGIEHPLSDEGRIAAFRDSGKGFVILTWHVGNWEWGGAYLPAIGVDLVDVAKHLHNPAADKFVSDLRDRFGIKVIFTRDNPIRIFRHIKKGGALSLFSDQDAGRDGVFVPFFGRLASTANGAAYFSYRLGVPILPLWGFKTAEGKIRVFSGEPLQANSAAPMDEEIERITRLQTAMLERVVRTDPGQYFWFHRRWKTRPKSEKKAAKASLAVTASASE